MGTCDQVHPAPDSAPLDYTQKAAEEAGDERRTRRDSGLNERYRYSIPDELREAARVDAESEPPAPSNGNHSAVAALMDRKYGTGRPDTFVPSQAVHTYNGLAQVVMDGKDEVSFGENGTEGALRKRASSAWWMATMAQRGSSPHAPSGYKVSQLSSEFVLFSDTIFSCRSGEMSWTMVLRVRRPAAFNLRTDINRWCDWRHRFVPSTCSWLDTTY